ncbi:MAG: hypothetical protein IPM77_04085 [Crocinitomicaceae bacterium]|nr:hypothetical protein [Crocinitomicaceae bacterium]
MRNKAAEFQLDSITTNSQALFNGKSDFWKDAFGFFEHAEKPVWFFAGDLGAHEFFKSYYEDHYKRFHFYGSGMGGGIRDNYLLVSVFRNGRVSVIKREF